MRSINQDGLQLIKDFEGFKSEPYLDAASKPTIGYGCTHYEDGITVTMNDNSINEERASELLQNLLNNEFCPKVEKLLNVKVNDNQFSAIVCFAYNVGIGNLLQSTLLRCLNAMNYTDASNEFQRWNKAGGIVLPGLVRRRAAEKALFLTA